MSKVIWLAAGVVLGLGISTLKGRTAPEGGILDDLDAKARAFGRTVRESYHARQDELRDAIGGEGRGERP